MEAWQMPLVLKKRNEFTTILGEAFGRRAKAKHFNRQTQSLRKCKACFATALHLPSILRVENSF